MAKVLVIDDDAEFLEMMRLLLQQRGEHQAILSADGKDGLAKAVADPPDLAVVDVMMPGTTGYEVCRQLRANPRTASIPIIVLTARGQPVDRQAALDAGADDHMTKPVTVAELQERINSLLAQHAALKQPAFTGTITLLSLRGGVGVTTLAVNLAATLVQADSGTVCLADLCSSSGHVALQLGLRPEPNWAGLVRAGGLTQEAVRTHLLQHASGLHVLASPVLPIAGQGLPRAVTQATLGILKQYFAVTVVDTPSALDEAAMVVLEAATVIGLVVTAEPPSIQTAVGTLGALKQWAARFQIILNQVAPGAQPPAAAIERALKRPVLETIPFDPDQAQALMRGAPLALSSPTSPLAQAARELAQKLTVSRQ